MKVKANFVPEDTDYIIAGKVYEVEVQEGGRSFILTSEYPDGEVATSLCLFQGCAHLEFCDWEIVE